MSGLVIKEIPEDNSCLFNAVGYVLQDGATDGGARLRELAAAVILEDADGTFTDAFLGKPKATYVNWILEANSWGGAIELAIFANFFGIEIASIDVKSGRIDLFGQGAGYEGRVYLLYSGIHYDALVWRNEGTEVRLFPASDSEVLAAALALCADARDKGRYTDLGGARFKCNDCGATLVGQGEAQTHAMSTNHSSFEEV